MRNFAIGVNFPFRTLQHFFQPLEAPLWITSAIMRGIFAWIPQPSSRCFRVFSARDNCVLAAKPPSGKRNVLGTSTSQTTQLNRQNTQKYAKQTEARCVKKVKMLMSSAVHSLDWRWQSSHEDPMFWYLLRHPPPSILICLCPLERVFGVYLLHDAALEKALDDLPARLLHAWPAKLSPGRSGPEKNQQVQEISSASSLTHWCGMVCYVQVGRQSGVKHQGDNELATWKRYALGRASNILLIWGFFQGAVSNEFFWFTPCFWTNCCKTFSSSLNSPDKVKKYEIWEKHGQSEQNKQLRKFEEEARRNVVMMWQHCANMCRIDAAKHRTILTLASSCICVGCVYSFVLGRPAAALAMAQSPRHGLLWLFAILLLRFEALCDLGEASKIALRRKGQWFGLPCVASCVTGRAAIHAATCTFVPECVARVPVSLWGSGGWGCVRSTLLNRSQPVVW